MADTKKVKGAFIIHPTDDDPESTYKKMVSRHKILSYLTPAFLHNVVRPNLPLKMYGMGCLKILTKGDEPVEIWLNFQGIQDLPREMKANEPKSLRKIRKAIQMQQKKGIVGVGLGAYASIIGEGGSIIANEFKDSVFVTTGNAYTAGTGVMAALDLGKKVGLDLKKSTVVIIAAVGGIGRIAAKLAAAEVGRVILVGQQIDQRLLDLAKEINQDGGKALAMTIEEALPKADIVISATSASEELKIDPDLFKKGAVIVDLARPRDIAREVAAERDNVLIIDGGIMACPEVLEQLWLFGLPYGTVYACMAETMILLAKGRTAGAFSLKGEITINWVKKLLKWGEELGFTLAGYRSFDTPLDEAKIEICRKIVLSRAK